MGRMLGFMQRHFWLPMALALVGGLLLPGIGEELKPTFKPALLIILTLVFTRIDLLEVLHHIRNPRLMAYLLVAKLVVIPLLLYMVLLPLAPAMAIGVLLLAAAPPAASAPVFCDLVRGNTALCVSFYILCYLVAPFTVTAVMGVTGLASLDLTGLFRSITLLIFLPMLIALMGKRWCPRLIARTRDHYGGINLLVVTYLIFAVVSALASRMRQDLVSVAGIVIVLYLVFALLHGIGYLLVKWRPPADRLAVSVATAYMNTALAVVLAIDFFPPEVVVVAVASEVPWCTMLGPFKWLHHRLSFRHVEQPS